jgi:DNA-binding protein
MIDESSDERLDENSDEKLDEGSDEKLDEKLDEKSDESSDEKLDENLDEKSDESSDEKLDVKSDEKLDKRSDENAIYVGKKPTMNYVLAVVTQFNSGSSEIIIKARGRSISRAVDVAEIVRHRFVSGATIKDIMIDTEPLATEEGATINVSSIEIILSMGK